MNDRDGGPAYPIGSGDIRDPAGMTMRQYYKAEAMKGLIAGRYQLAREETIALAACYADLAIDEDEAHEREEC